MTYFNRHDRALIWVGRQGGSGTWASATARALLQRKVLILARFAKGMGMPAVLTSRQENNFDVQGSPMSVRCDARPRRAANDHFFLNPKEKPMKTIGKLLHALAPGATSGLLPQVQVQNKTLVATEGLTFGVPTNSVSGKSREGVHQAMLSFSAVIRKQRGLFVESLLENKNPASKPDYAHVTRWRGLKNWEALIANSSILSVGSAGLFLPVK